MPASPPRHDNYYRHFQLHGLISPSIILHHHFSPLLRVTGQLRLVHTSLSPVRCHIFYRFAPFTMAPPFSRELHDISCMRRRNTASTLVSSRHRLMTYRRSTGRHADRRHAACAGALCRRDTHRSQAEYLPFRHIRRRKQLAAL